MPGIHKETIQVILAGKKIVGTRGFIAGGANSLQQFVEFAGQRHLDPVTYRGNADDAAMLWQARRILADLYEAVR